MYDYAIDTVKDEILSKFNIDEKDIFVRIRQGSLLKLEILKKHPEIYNFIVTAYMEDPGEVKSDLESRNKGLIANSQGILSKGFAGAVFVILSVAIIAVFAGVTYVFYKKRDLNV